MASNNKRSHKTGLAPGTMLHTGEKKEDNISITVANYNERYESFDECKDAEDAISKVKGRGYVTWINVDGLHDLDSIRRIGEKYKLHPLLLEDIVSTDQRPKVEDYGDYLFIVMRMLQKSEKGNKIISEQFSVVLGPDYVISFQETKGDCFDNVRARIKQAQGNTRRYGADYLTYTLMDSIVDNYFIILEEFGEHIEKLEMRILESSDSKIVQTLNHMKREIIMVRKSVWPLREVINNLVRGYPVIKKTTTIYLRDVYDHTIQIIDNVESYRDMLSSMLDIYLSTVSNRMNEVMKVLTIIATIFIPLTFIAGVYGMNFRYMPELYWHYGYFTVLAVMAIVVIFMLSYFRRKKWL